MHMKAKTRREALGGFLSAGFGLLALGWLPGRNTLVRTGKADRSGCSSYRDLPAPRPAKHAVKRDD